MRHYNMSYSKAILKVYSVSNRISKVEFGIFYSLYPEVEELHNFSSIDKEYPYTYIYQYATGNIQDCVIIENQI